jgi:hypothetical protein
MRRINKFENLSPEDREIVLKTCANNPYHVALRILARPRAEGGLNLHTSRTALARFCVHHHPDQRSLELIGQYADAVRIKGQAHLSGAFEAALTLVQARILEALQNGKSVADLDREFRSLERLQRCLINGENRRDDRGDAAGAQYVRHIREAAIAPQTDFIRNDLPEDPGAGGVTEADFDTLSDKEMHVIAARLDAHYPVRDERPRDVTLGAVTAAEIASHEEAFGLPKQRQFRSKSPDFLHFPPNPGSNEHYAQENPLPHTRSIET